MLKISQIKIQPAELGRKHIPPPNKVILPSSKVCPNIGVQNALKLNLINDYPFSPNGKIVKGPKRSRGNMVPMVNLLKRTNGQTAQMDKSPYGSNLQMAKCPNGQIAEVPNRLNWQICQKTQMANRSLG